MVVLNLFVEYLGGFFSVTLLILVLLLSRAAVRRRLQRPHQRALGQA